jgi:acetyltransferase-like isoleucine patch superfamily enzyme
MRSLVLRMEGGTVYSLTIREIYRRFHGVTVGLYTIGPCTMPLGNLAPGTTVGRYSSIYYTVRTISQDYPANGSLPDGLFSDSALGDSKTKTPKTDLVIGNDVFIGHNAIILPSVKEIGDGAVIGAGSVLHSSVPPYAVVTGNPARVVRFRFSEQKITELLGSKWWLKSIDELTGEIEEFRKPLEVSAPIR